LGSGIYVVESGIAGQEPRITETLQLRFAKVEQMTSIINSMLEKTGKATAYSEGNAILIQAPASKISEIQRIVKILDRPRSQVYIEARFVEMTAAASKKLGLKWDPLDGMSVGVNEVAGGFSATQGKLAQYLTGVNDFVDTDGLDTTAKVPISTLLLAKDLTGAGGMSADEVQWKRMRGIKGQISASDFSLVMSAFEKEDGVSTISNPKIIVANEETAIVDMTTKEPYVLVESQRNTSGDGLTTQDINTKLGIIPGSSDGPSSGEAFFSYGVTLKVRPRVSSSGVITVLIEPSISSRDLSQGIDGYYVVGNNDKDTPSTKYPIISIKKIRTTFSMLDGSTAVIGGLTRSSEANIDSGIPLLREIPWIGPRLFGWKSRAKDQREIVIFVTVGIVNPEEDMPEDIGMPKNAVLTRDFQEPGDRPREDLMRLKK